VTLVVPDVQGPRKLPAFFNPRGKLVRDVSLVCYRAFANRFAKKTGLTFADSLAGVGSRGLRFASEVPSCERVFLNDVNSVALDCARRSAEMNGLADKCIISESDACAFLVARFPSGGERFDMVDVDPFGTPSPFVDCALRGTKHGGLISLSATDSAVLCGVYPDVARAKYLGSSLRTDYCHEMGIRLMFGLLAMCAIRFESGIEPLFSHHDLHYFRIYAMLKVGNSRAREAQSKLGYVLHCFRCGFRATSPNLETRECPHCPGMGKKLALGGPCWIGNIQERSFVRACANLEESSSRVSLLFRDELDLPLYYNLDELSHDLSTRTPSIQGVIEELNSRGFSAGRTRLNPKALRTDAPLPLLRSLVLELVR
jgi:tRNA (guanine26-N2/guanine27-N2)-dimethyltransferase